MTVGVGAILLVIGIDELAAGCGWYNAGTTGYRGGGGCDISCEGFASFPVTNSGNGCEKKGMTDLQECRRPASPR